MLARPDLGLSDIYHIVLAQFFCEDGRAKRLVAADVDASEKDHESHTGIIKNGAARHEYFGSTARRTASLRTGRPPSTTTPSGSDHRRPTARVHEFSFPAA